jgi:hypothetical protein
MKVREFLALLSAQVASQLPPDLRGFSVQGPRGSLVKLYYGDSARIHYEVWVQRRLGQIELGLHFEADPETNVRLLALLAGQFVAVRRGLGPAAEPEQWTASWTRLHETLPLEPLDKTFLRRVASRMARYIRTLQPLLADAATAGPTSRVDPLRGHAYNKAP